MADKTPIEWTDATWNPVTGCSVVSPGCTNCYAMKLAGTRLRNMPSRKGLTNQTKAGPVWNGQLRFNEEFALQPLQWKRPRMIFVCAHGDLFAEGVPDEWIDRVFAVMALAPHHTFQVLTKRAHRMRAYVNDPKTIVRVYDLVCDLAIEHRINVTLIANPAHALQAPPGPRVYLGQWPLSNVWKGVSAEDQKRANERVPDLAYTLAAIRWVSAEPLLGSLDLERILFCEKYYRSGAHHYVDVLRGGFWSPKPFFRASQDGEEKGFFTNHSDLKDNLIHWVVAGGESGSASRPMHPDWPRQLRDQCKNAGVPFFFKQWGNWREWSDVASGFQNCSRFDRLGNVTEARARLHSPYRNGFQQPEGDFPWRGNFLRFPKSVAGRLLDGVTHDAFPKTERAV